MLRYMRTLIMEISDEVFQCENFKFILQETLIGILSLDELRISEVELLEDISKWVDNKVKINGLTMDNKNKRKIFEPIKPYIVFSSLTAEQIAGCKEIETLLTPEETGLLALHVLNKSRPLMIECKTARRVASDLKRVVYDSLSSGAKSLLRKPFLTVSGGVEIFIIYSTYPYKVKNPCLAILGPNGVDLDLKCEIFLLDGCWCFSPKPPLKAKPSTKYQLVFTTDEKAKWDIEMSDQKRSSCGENFVFNLEFPTGQEYHPIKKIDFLPSK